MPPGHRLEGAKPPSAPPRPARVRAIAGRRLVLGAVAALVLGACTSGGGSRPAPGERGRPPELEGEWRWVETVERRTDRVLTPAGRGYSARLRLALDEADGADGRYEYVRDGRVVATGGFSLSFEDAAGNDFVLWRPPFGGFHRQQWVGVSGDTLRLRDATAGGYTVRWVRAR